MKKVINGKRYDTEAARKVAATYHGNGDRDFSHWSEILYKKRTGEYFLYGEGGPLTQYAVWHGDNERSGGEKIIPITIATAKTWLEKYGDVETYEAEFGKVPEDDTKETVSFSLPHDVMEGFRRKCAEEGTNFSEKASELIKEWISE